MALIICFIMVVVVLCFKLGDASSSLSEYNFKMRMDKLCKDFRDHENHSLEMDIRNDPQKYKEELGEIIEQACGDKAEPVFWYSPKPEPCANKKKAEEMYKRRSGYFNTFCMLILANRGYTFSEGSSKIPWIFDVANTQGDWQETELLLLRWYVNRLHEIGLPYTPVYSYSHFSRNPWWDYYECDDGVSLIEYTWNEALKKSGDIYDSEKFQKKYYRR